MIIKTSLNPEWSVRFAQFWFYVKSLGIKTDEKKLFIDSIDQIEQFYAATKKYGINIVLIKEN